MMGLMNYLRNILVILVSLTYCEYAACGYAELVADVDSVYSPGSPGPLWFSDENWSAIAGSSADAGAIPIFIAAREYGSGRVMAAGHEGFLMDLSLADNEVFIENTFAWLCGTRGKDIAYLDGCWLTISTGSALDNNLQSNGYTVSGISAPLTADKLKGKSCLVVGNMWGYKFTTEEVDLVRNYVVNGGGLLMLGLGWSWNGYHPGQTIDDYPMTILAKPFGVRWLDGSLSSNMDLLYPELNMFSMAEAMNYIRATHQGYLTNLAQVLQNDETIRNRYFQSNATLSVPLTFTSNDPERHNVYQFYFDLINDYPLQLKRNVIYDAETYPAMVQSREQIYHNMIVAMEPSDSQRLAVADIIGLAGSCRNLFMEHKVLLLDNGGLNEEQKSFIYRYMNIIPAGLENLEFISVRDFWGNKNYNLSMPNNTGMVNIFGFDLGLYSENSFGWDSEPGIIDVFSVVVAHEVNHVVDAYTLGHNADMLARRNELIIQAAPDDVIFNIPAVGGIDWQATKNSFISGGYWGGDESTWSSAWTEYWSSGPGQQANERWLRDNLQLMCEAPQESFATLSNQYFTNSETMLNLAISRWNRGMESCINQFLFFVDVYSTGSSQSRFYRIDTNGNIRYDYVYIGRDNNGHIYHLAYNTTEYYFDLDGDGNVLGIYWPIYNPALPADINKDWKINILDLEILAEYWLNPQGDNLADINYDTEIGIDDFGIIAKYWE